MRLLDCTRPAVTSSLAPRNYGRRASAERRGAFSPVRGGRHPLRPSRQSRRLEGQESAARRGDRFGDRSEAKWTQLRATQTALASRIATRISGICRVVVPAVAGSNPVAHPSRTRCKVPGPPFASGRLPCCSRDASCEASAGSVASLEVALEFRILGPLEVRSGTGPIPLGGAKTRALLAALLLERNRPVDPERLALALWGEDAAHGSGRGLRGQISRLRALRRGKG